MATVQNGQAIEAIENATSSFMCVCGQVLSSQQLITSSSTQEFAMIGKFVNLPLPSQDFRRCRWRMGHGDSLRIRSTEVGYINDSTNFDRVGGLCSDGTAAVFRRNATIQPQGSRIHWYRYVIPSKLPGTRPPVPGCYQRTRGQKLRVSIDR
jgi:hypothetical protein